AQLLAERRAARLARHDDMVPCFTDTSCDPFDMAAFAGPVDAFKSNEFSAHGYVSGRADTCSRHDYVRRASAKTRSTHPPARRSTAHPSALDEALHRWLRGPARRWASAANRGGYKCYRAYRRASRCG